MPQRMKRNRRGTRCTTWRRVSTLRMRHSAESRPIDPSTVTHGSRQRNRRRVSHAGTAAPAGNERVAQRRAEYDGGLRRALRRGFDPAQPDSQLPDAGGVGRAQLLELGAAEAERLHRGDLLAQPCAVAFDFGGEGGLIVGQTPAFPAGVAAGAAGAGEQRRRQDGVAEKEFFHD